MHHACSAETLLAFWTGWLFILGAVLGSRAGPYPLEASGIPPHPAQLLQPSVSPDMAKCPLGAKLTPAENNWPEYGFCSDCVIKQCWEGLDEVHGVGHPRMNVIGF